MPRHSTYRTRGAVESVGGEWSSGQLGIGIAVAVIFGLVCFILGYVVANVDRPIVDEIVAISGDDIGQKSDNPDASTPSGPTSGSRPVQASATRPTGATTAPAEGIPGGAPETTTAANRPPAPAPGAPTRPSQDPGQRPGLGARDIEALPSPGAPTAMVKTTVPIGAIGTAPVTAAPAATTALAPAPIIPPDPPKPVLDEPADDMELEAVAVNTPPSASPVKPPVSAPAPKPTATTTPATTTPAPRPPTVTRGSYGVQVAAFNGPRRAEQAAESRKRLKEATGLDAEIRRTPDGAYEKVIVTGFSTPEEAKAQCDKLKSKDGYASSWVVRLP